MFHLVKLMYVDAENLKSQWHAWCSKTGNYNHYVALYLSMLFFAPDELLTVTTTLPHDFTDLIWLTPHSYTYVCAFFVAHSANPPLSNKQCPSRHLQLFKYLRQLRHKVLPRGYGNSQKSIHDRKHIERLIQLHDNVSSAKWLNELKQPIPTYYIIGILLRDDLLSKRLLVLLSKQRDIAALLDGIFCKLGAINYHEQLPLWFGTKVFAHYVLNSSVPNLAMRHAVLLRYVSSRQCNDQEFKFIVHAQSLDAYDIFQCCIRINNFKRARHWLEQQTDSALWTRVCEHIDELTTALLVQNTKTLKNEMRDFVDMLHKQFTAITNTIDSSFDDHLRQALCDFARDHSSSFHKNEMWHWLFNTISDEPTRDDIIQELWLMGKADFLLGHYLQSAYTNRLLTTITEKELRTFSSEVSGTVPELFAHSTITIHEKIKRVTEVQAGLPFLTVVDCLAVIVCGVILRVRTLLILLMICIPLAFLFPTTLVYYYTSTLLACSLMFFLIIGMWRCFFDHCRPTAAEFSSGLIAGILLFWAQFTYAMFAEQFVGQSVLLVTVIGVVTVLVTRVLLVTRIRPRFSTQLYFTIMPMALVPGMITLFDVYTYRHLVFLLSALFWQLAPTSYGQLII